MPMRPVRRPDAAEAELVGDRSKEAGAASGAVRRRQEPFQFSERRFSQRPVAAAGPPANDRLVGRLAAVAVA
ncbi:MAG TPA: hypothetical protein VM008_10865 [Phycisphaerae bacterium]|nr:hypothetical protein [Phycisphaerae bacterium]